MTTGSDAIPPPGDDKYGKDALALYDRVGIRTDSIAIDTTIHSGISVILIDRDGHNLISVVGEDIIRQEGENLKAIFNDEDFLASHRTPREGVVFAATTLATDYHSCRVLSNILAAPCSTTDCPAIAPPIPARPSAVSNERGGPFQVSPQRLF